jgi:hypothetical protein
LPSTQVDAGLAADRCVDHADQRGADVHHGNAAVPGCRCEPGHVGDHAAAHSDDHVVAGEPHPREPATQRLDGGERLVLLAVADDEAFEREARLDLQRDALLGDSATRRAVDGSSAASSLRAPLPTRTS